MVPLDWLRSMLPGTGIHHSFYSGFDRGPYRAAYHLALLVALIEGLRLGCFLMLHQERFEMLSPKHMAAQMLTAWPEDLVVILSRGGDAPLDVSTFTVSPELRLNQPLPYEVRLPTCVASGFNLLLSFLMRSAVMLEFLPERPVVLFAREGQLNDAVRAAAKAHRDQSLFAVLAERTTFVAYALPGVRKAASSVKIATSLPAVGHQILEALAHAVCEPMRAEDLAAVVAGGGGGGDGGGGSGSGGDGSDSSSPLHSGGGAGAGYRAARGGSGAASHAGGGGARPSLARGVACRRRHVASLTRGLSTSGFAFGRFLGWALLASVHMCSWLLALSEALLSAVMVVPAMLLLSHCLGRPMGLLRPLRFLVLALRRLCRTRVGHRRAVRHHLLTRQCAQRD